MSTEQTPLIFDQDDTPTRYEAAQAAPAGAANKPLKKQTPLPKLQLFTILFIQFCEPVTATVIYPFIVKLVRETGITGGDDAKTGYYAGCIESVFFAAEALTVLQWGRASDRIGRKLPLVFGMLGLAVAITSFGLSDRFWPLVISRCMQGVFNGNVGITKSVLAEITDSTNMAKAFSFIPLSWGLGVTLGPLIGGVLSHPAEQWPDTFGKLAFLRQFPYFLPCITAALLPFSAFIFSAVFFKETLLSAILNKRKQAAERSSVDHNPENDVLIQISPDSLDTKPPPPLRSLMTRRVVIALVNYGFLSWTEQACSVSLNLTYALPISYGGLGLNPFTIGAIMSSLGLLIGGFCAVFFPIAMRRYSATQVYRACYSGYLINMLLLPLMNYLARRHGEVDAVVWAVLMLQMLCASFSIMCFSAVFMLLSEASPTGSSLGAINGLAQTVACSMRIFAPITASSLFSLSQEKNLLGGTMVFWVVGIIIIGGIYVSFQLEEPPKSEDD